MTDIAQAATNKKKEEDTAFYEYVASHDRRRGHECRSDGIYGQYM